jgi:hypothetical protein
MREWAALFRREVLDWLSRPALYVLLIAYWLLSGLLAFNVLLEARVLTLEPYFQIAPILLALFILAVTSGQLCTAATNWISCGFCLYGHRPSQACAFSWCCQFWQQLWPAA